MTSKQTTDQPAFNIYSFEVSVSLLRRTGQYDSSRLVKFNIEQELPARDDQDAREKLVDLVSEALDRSYGIITARIDLEDTVKRLASGGDFVDTTVEQEAGGFGE